MTDIKVKVLRTVRVAHLGTVYGREIVQGTNDEVPAAQFEDLAAAGYIEALPVEPGGSDLRDDGPTVTEYVAAGYLASNYPPQGYASRSTPEEIAAAIAAATPPPAPGVDGIMPLERNADGSLSTSALVTETTANEGSTEDDGRAVLAKMTNVKLHEIAAAEQISVEGDDNKQTLIDKIMAARAAAAA